MNSTSDTSLGSLNTQSGSATNTQLDLPGSMQHLYLKDQQDLQQSSSSKESPPTFTNFFYEFKRGAPNSHARATPLFEVASVRIDSNQFKDLDCVNIYGAIVLIDDHGNEFYIFDCKDRNDAKTLILDPETPTSAILQNFQPRGLPSKFCLLFQLKRRLNDAAEEDIVIFDDYKYIWCTHKVLYDKQQTVVFEDSTSQYMISVSYTIYQCALILEVGVIVEKSGKNASDGAVVSGDIVATNRLIDMLPYRRTLLAVSSKEFDFGNYIPLSTLAVPAYATLEIRAQLSVNGEDVSDILKFEPFTTMNIFHEKQIGRRPYRIRVIVFWRHGATSLPESNILEYCVKRSETPFTHQRPPSKILQTEHVGAYYIQPGVKQYLNDLEWDNNDFRTELLEIFSISVCAYDRGDSALSLKGEVICYDYKGCQCIFDSDTTRGVSTSSGIVKLVPDLGRGFVGSYLGIETDLKDDQGREISFGRAQYGLPSIEGWRDRRICSVIRGQDGFAAVHYAIFSDAVLAKLSFEVECGSDAGCQVYGSINAWYSHFNYSTHYAKKYYRITLFEKGKRNAVKLGDGEVIPLSKSALAVPVYGSLVVEASIYVQNGKVRENLMFKGTFCPKGGALRESVSGRYNICLSVAVERVLNIPFF